MRGLTLAALLAAALLPVAASARSPLEGAASGRQCFSLRDWSNTRGTPDSKSAYIRVRQSQVFRLDFTGGCPGLNFPSHHLVTNTTTSLICSPLDLDVKVSDGNGFSTHCIVSNITSLSKAEAAALPKTLTP